MFATKKSKFWVHDTHPVFKSIGCVSNSFCDLAPPIESPRREKHTQNTIRPNEFTDFEKFKPGHPKTTKTISGPTSTNGPVAGITLQLTAPRVSSNYAFARAPGAREDPKRPIGAEPFVYATVPGPVLLFGVTTLRVT